MKTIGLLALLALCVVGGWMLFYPRAVVNYRLTVEVETPEGVKTGSVVNQVGYSLEPAIGTRGSNAGTPQGEAAVVDLGTRGALFVLLTGRDPKTGTPGGISPPILYLRTLAPDVWRMDPRTRDFIYAVRAVNAKAELPQDFIPFMVRFRDEKDPKTVEAVDPQNLAASFGDGVKLKRVTIETSHDPVTHEIGKRLGWLDNLKTGSITGITEWDPSRPDPVNYLPAVSFRQGTRK